MRYRKALILGGSGLFGLNCGYYLNPYFDCFLALNRRQISVDFADTIMVDSSNPNFLLNLLRDLKIDLVINSAGLTSVELCETNPRLALEANVLLAKTAAVCCQTLKIKLVHISTDHLFDGLRGPYSESDEVKPINEYARTKCEAERLVKKISPDALILRTNFYGWGTRHRLSFSDWIISELEKGSDVHLFNDAMFSPVSMRTLALAIQSLTQKNMCGTYNVSSNEGLSKWSFGVRLAQIFGLPVANVKQSLISTRTDLVPRPLDLRLSNKKLTQHGSYYVPSLDEELYDLANTRSNSSWRLSI